jgi:cell division protein FtsI/penicillin-binding protein 2
MLVSVVENGHSQEVRSENYYLAGKTGTAQIAGPGGYLELATNHTFAGFGPASNPRLALVVKYEQPQRDWADSTAGPVFKEVMEYALHYLGVPEDR